MLAGGREHRLFMYMDYILLLLSNSASSIPGVVDIFEISGYKTKWQKSEVMPVFMGFSPAVTGAFTFKCLQSGGKYLGI